MIDFEVFRRALTTIAKNYPALPIPEEPLKIAQAICDESFAGQYRFRGTDGKKYVIYVSPWREILIREADPKNEKNTRSLFKAEDFR
jgi:hypothetical protein